MAMRHTRELLIVLLAVSVIALAGCPGPKQGTPEELIKSAHKAGKDGDLSTLAKLIEPDVQGPVKEMADMAEDLKDSLEDLADVVEDKVEGGEKEAKEIREGFGNMPGVSMGWMKKAEKDGELDMSKLEFKTEGDTCTVKLKEGYGQAKLKKVDGKWYFESKSSKEDMQKQLDEAKKELPKFQKVIDDLIKAVKDGEVKTTADLNKKRMELTMKHMKDED
jgi:hypothetical protein